MLYRLLRSIARIALRWYYRSIEIAGSDRIPFRGPIILAANHNNALVDALLVAGAIDREVRLTAKATLLDNPFTKVVVRSVGIVPLRRVADEVSRTGGPAHAERNVAAFEAVVETLASGGVLLIFPEGISHSEPMLAPLRTGCARMALQAASAGVRDIRIIPVGLTFEAKGLPRSRVVIHIGEPIAVNEVMHVADAVGHLTAAVEAGLHSVTLNFPTQDDATAVLDVAGTLAMALEDTRSLESPLPPLANTIQLARRVETVRRRLPLLPASERERALAFSTSLRSWRARARELHVAASDVGMPTGTLHAAWFVFRELLIALTVGPIALWGRVNHWLPLTIAMAIGRRTSRNPDEPAMHTLVGGAALVTVTYVLVASALWRVLGWPWSLLYLGSLVPAASVDFWWRDRIRAATRRARGFLSLRRHRDAAHELSTERDRLRREAGDLAALFL